MKLKTLFSFGAAMMTALLMSCSETIAEQGNGQKNTKLDEKTFVVSLNLDGGQGDDKNTGKAPQTRGIAVDRQQNNGTDSEILDFYFWDENTPVLSDYIERNKKKGNNTFTARCVFKRAEGGKFVDGSELYGEIKFNQVGTSRNIKYKGDIVLKGNGATAVLPKKGEEWYVMGLAGGQYNETDHTVDVTGFAYALEKYQSVRNVVDNKGKYGVIPFLSTWKKVNVADAGTLVSQEPLVFNPQGPLLRIALDNQTFYDFTVKFLGISSNVLANNVKYDLSSTGLGTTPSAVASDFKWEYTGNVNESGMNNFEWNLNMEDPIKIKRRSNVMQNADGTGQDILIYVWVNSKAPASGDTPRTGFFTSTYQDKVATKGNQNNKNEYVLTTHEYADELMTEGWVGWPNLGNGRVTWKVGKDQGGCTPAPSFEWVLSKTLTTDFTQLNGRQAKVTLPIVMREPIPLEYISQKSAYRTDYFSQPQWIKELGGDNLVTIAYLNNGDLSNGLLRYLKQPRNKDVNNTTGYKEGVKWIVPNENQWCGVLLSSTNVTRNRTVNPAWLGDTEQFSSDEDIITIGNGSKVKDQKFYSRYINLPKTHRNRRSIYALRFFEDAEHTKVSPYFCVVKYTWVQTDSKNSDKASLTVEALPLKEAYLTLYGGADKLLKAIAHNDDAGKKLGLFYWHAGDVIRRYFCANQSGLSFNDSHPDVPRNNTTKAGRGFLVAKDTDPYAPYELGNGAYDVINMQNGYIHMGHSLQRTGANPLPGGALDYSWFKTVGVGNTPKFDVRLLRKKIEFKELP